MIVCLVSTFAKCCNRKCRGQSEGKEMNQKYTSLVCCFVCPMTVSGEFVHFFVINYAYICAGIRLNLKETVLKSIITWPSLGKQTIQAKDTRRELDRVNFRKDFWDWSYEFMKIIHENCWVKKYLKEDHRSYRKKKSRTGLKFFWLSFRSCKSCVYISAMIFFHGLLAQLLRTLHRYRGGQSFESRINLNFFRLSSRNCKRCA